MTAVAETRPAMLAGRTELGRITVQVRSRWGVPAPDLAALITTVVASVTGPRPVDVVIADVDDPPAAPSLRRPAGARPPGPVPDLPPA